MTTILNQDLATPGQYTANFKDWRKILIAKGTLLFKFTEYGLYSGREISPWWAFVHPQPGGDPGLDAELAKAKASGRDPVDYFRERFAVMFKWNALHHVQSGLLRVQRIGLMAPVFGFHGLAASVLGEMRPVSDPNTPGRILEGGAYQLYIPGLTALQMMGVGINLI